MSLLDFNCTCSSIKLPDIGWGNSWCGVGAE